MTIIRSAASVMSAAALMIAPEHAIAKTVAPPAQLVAHHHSAPRRHERVSRTQAANAATIRRLWPQDTAARALRVAWCESRWKADARERHTGATGLFQITPRWHGEARRLGLWPLTDPANNTRMAVHILHTQGWKAWTCQ